MCYQHYNLNLISQLQRQSMPEPVPDVVNQIVDNNNDLLILAISCTNSQSDWYIYHFHYNQANESAFVCQKQQLTSNIRLPQT